MTAQATRQAGPDAEERLAGTHLRVGLLLLARAELEALASRGALTSSALADLSEARWRTGDLRGAAAAAAAHLAAGGDQPIARLVLAEAESAEGRPEAAADHIAALADLSDVDLGTMFAGMPHRAAWPTLAAGGVEPRGSVGPAPVPAPVAGAPVPAGAPTEVEPGAGPGRRSTRRPPAPAFPEGSELLVEARADMRSGEPERMAAAFDRLALALRLDPAIAGEVVALITRRQEPAAQVVRGDALRILGRVLEAEASYAGAAAALDRRSRRTS